METVTAGNCEGGMTNVKEKKEGFTLSIVFPPKKTSITIMKIYHCTNMTLKSREHQAE